MLLYGDFLSTSGIYVLRFEFGSVEKVDLAVTRMNSLLADDLRYFMDYVAGACEGFS